MYRTRLVPGDTQLREEKKQTPTREVSIDTGGLCFITSSGPDGLWTCVCVFCGLFFLEEHFFFYSIYRGRGISDASMWGVIPCGWMHRLIGQFMLMEENVPTSTSTTHTHTRSRVHSIGSLSMHKNVPLMGSIRKWEGQATACASGVKKNKLWCRRVAGDALSRSAV